VHKEGGVSLGTVVMARIRCEWTNSGLSASGRDAGCDRGACGGQEEWIRLRKRVRLVELWHLSLQSPDTSTDVVWLHPARRDPSNLPGWGLLGAYAKEEALVPEVIAPVTSFAWRTLPHPKPPNPSIITNSPLRSTTYPPPTPASTTSTSRHARLVPLIHSDMSTCPVSP
jgi:hypothetical protein